MKRVLSILLVLVLIFSISACSKKEKESEAGKQETAASLKYGYDYAYNSLDQSVKSAYDALCTAVLSYQPELRVNTAFVGDICDMFNTSFPIPFLVKNITPKEDRSGVTIEYTKTAEEHQEAIATFTQAVEAVHKQCSENSGSKGTYLVNAYHAAVTGMKETADNSLTVYDAFVSGKGNANTFAKMFEYLLYQEEIPVYHIIASDMANNMVYLSMAELDGSYYYFDVYGEAQSKSESGISLFGMNFTELKNFGIQDPKNYTSEPLPDSIDLKFDVCRKAVSWEIQGADLLITTKTGDLVKLTL